MDGTKAFTVLEKLPLLMSTFSLFKRGNAEPDSRGPSFLGEMKSAWVGTFPTPLPTHTPNAIHHPVLLTLAHKYLSLPLMVCPVLQSALPLQAVIHTGMCSEYV